MTFLVTGAAGFLGSHITDLLVARGEPTRAFVHQDDDTRLLSAAGVDIHRGDICDRDAVAAALEGADRVLHCAARTGPWGPESEYERTNFRGLETLVRCALDAGVRRVVHVSSITVHGNDVRGQADENAPLREEPNPYSRSKVAGERLLQRLIAEEGAPVTIVRPGWLYGPRDASGFSRLARAVESGRIVMIGSGRNHVPLLYVEDAARGVVAAGESRRAEGRSYLLVNDEPVTQSDFLGAVATALGASIPHRRIPYRLALSGGLVAEIVGRLSRRRQPPPVMRYGVQLLGGENRFVIDRARHELGFVPEVDLEEGVKRSVDWYRATHRTNEAMVTA